MPTLAEIDASLAKAYAIRENAARSVRTGDRSLDYDHDVNEANILRLERQREALVAGQAPSRLHRIGMSRGIGA